MRATRTIREKAHQRLRRKVYCAAAERGFKRIDCASLNEIAKPYIRN